MSSLATVSVRRTPLHRQVADLISERIISGEFAADDLIPPERELCEAMGVSRTVIRESIKLLESRGLVRIEHGRGTIVTHAHTGSVRDSLNLLLRRQGRLAVEDLLEVRRILEVGIAGLAAQRRTAANLRAMQAALETMRQNPDQPAGYVDADVEFHAEIARASRNPVILALLEPLTDLLRESRVKSFSGSDFVKQRIRQHEEILDRIRSGDADAAREAMRSHLADVGKDLARGKKSAKRSAIVNRK